MPNIKSALAEAVVVGAVGLIVALGANAISARGLRLSRNYFPGAPSTAVVQANTNSSTGSGVAPVLVSSNQPLDAVAARLQQQGLQLITSNGVVEVFRDARYEQGLVAFIDARDDHHYQAGHIPGAWQFNHYRPELYLPTVLPACLNAQKIVVYCNGGACEDSEFAAIMLRDVGIQREKLFVYAGGITEWMSNGLPVEVGARRSGVLKAK